MKDDHHRVLFLFAVSTLAVIARGVAVVLSAPFCLAYLWFRDSFNAVWLAYFFTSIPCMVIVPILPRQLLYRFLPVRVLVVLACSTSIVLTLPIMHDDLTLVNGADDPAFMIRCVQVFALAVLILEAVVNPNMRKPESAPRD